MRSRIFGLTPAGVRRRLKSGLHIFALPPVKRLLRNCVVPGGLESNFPLYPALRPASRDFVLGCHDTPYGLSLSLPSCSTIWPIAPTLWPMAEKDGAPTDVGCANENAHSTEGRLSGAPDSPLRTNSLDCRALEVVRYGFAKKNWPLRDH